MNTNECEWDHTTAVIIAELSRVSTVLDTVKTSCGT